MIARILLFHISLTALCSAQADRPLISRLLLEKTQSRAIAVGYPDGFNVALNSVDLTPLYVWKGGFIDDRNETNGRGGRACKTKGARIYLGLPKAPLRLRDAATMPVAITFKGYRRPKGAPPEFFAEIDGTPVSLRIVSETENIVSLHYEFAAPLTNAAYFQTGKIPANRLSMAAPLSWKDGVVTIPKGSQKFTIRMSIAGQTGTVTEAKKLNGKELHALHCSACHSLAGQKLIGPSFKGLFGKKEIVLVGGKQKEIVADEPYIRNSIIAPQDEIVAGFAIAPMPSYKEILTKEEIDSLVTFIKQLK